MYRKCLYILCLVFFFACNKEEENEEQTGSSNNTTASFYFYATIDGEEVSLDNVGGYSSSAGYNSSNDGSRLHVEQSMVLNNSAQTRAVGVSLSQAFNPDQENCSSFRSMFSVRNYGYGNIDWQTEGATVFYTDENGKFWSSAQTGGAQANASFKITSHSQGSYGFGANGITVAEFSCTLYDNIGNFKELTNGRLRSYSVQCFN